MFHFNQRRTIMRTTTLIVTMPMLLFLGGCAHLQTRSPNPNIANPAERAEVLTSFSIAITAKDFQRVLDLLAPAEKAKLISKGGQLDGDTKKQLSAIRLSTLATDPDVEVIDGKIHGIVPDKLPVLDLGPEPTLSDIKSEDEFEDVKKTAMERDARLKKLWLTFTDAVKKRQFDRALALIHPSEQSFFVTHNGGLSSHAKKNLPDIVENLHWSQLVLHEGKLEQLWVYLPPMEPEDKIAVRRFINAIQNNQWGEALSMLSDYEREFLSDKRGHMKPQYKNRLKGLTESDWRKFFFYKGKLSGTLDWMGMGPYGMQVSRLKSDVSGS